MSFLVILFSILFLSACFDAENQTEANTAGSAASSSDAPSYIKANETSRTDASFSESLTAYHAKNNHPQHEEFSRTMHHEGKKWRLLLHTDHDNFENCLHLYDDADTLVATQYLEVQAEEKEIGLAQIEIIPTSQGDYAALIFGERSYQADIYKLQNQQLEYVQSFTSIGEIRFLDPEENGMYEYLSVEFIHYDGTVESYGEYWLTEDENKWVEAENQG
ncbi:hypothetical protein [Alkalicoccus daliensis]|uniref:Lipoprotein n=1 Tax=Alkalicoccus daliensis TaxID=745820 RepID=A0A1H0G7H3_9BACI|nr:hypothetical protein [Alkalicoccus daliensis]SDO02863.1 hypothetical protein SAMN04488053_1066 [Alkalicoccus daliensis]